MTVVLIAGLSVYPGWRMYACQMDQFEPEFQHLDYLICIQTDFGITSFKSLFRLALISRPCLGQNHRADKDQSLQDHNAASSRTVNVVM